MAIRKLAAVFFVHFQDPLSGEPEYADAERRRPVGVMVHSPGSLAAKKVDSQIVQANINRQAKKISAELLEANALAKLIGSTYEFVNFDAVDGFQDKEYSPENARAFFTDPDYAHLRDQVQEKIGDFSAALETTSTSS